MLFWVGHPEASKSIRGKAKQNRAAAVNLNHRQKTKLAAQKLLHFTKKYNS